MQRNCALALGIMFLLLGIAGFIPSLVTLPAESLNTGGVSLDADSFYAKGFGYVFGAFPTNLMHNIVRVLVGVLGIVAANTGNAKLYNRGLTIICVSTAVMGALVTRTTFGIMPIFGNDVWLNGLSGVIAGYYGFFGKDTTTTTELNA